MKITTKQCSIGAQRIMGERKWLFEADTDTQKKADTGRYNTDTSAHHYLLVMRVQNKIS